MVLKWGILGSGRIAKDFACSMMAVDGSECVAVASRKPSKSLTAFAASFSCRAHDLRGVGGRHRGGRGLRCDHSSDPLRTRKDEP